MQDLRQKPKILIIEDNKYNHPLYRDAFEKAGFEVEIHENADGFFPEDVEKSQPSIISMDIMLGHDGASAERDGLDAIEKLKEDLRTYKIPVFILTNFFEENKIKRAKALGAVDYFISSSQPLNKIAEHLMQYLKDPKHYMPSHPNFRKES